MTLRTMKLRHAYFLLAFLAATPALAQVSASVAAGNISGNAQAGINTPGSHTSNDRIARGPRTDDTSNCDTRGVTVHSGNGSASAGVSTSPGGSSSVAGGGSPGSRTEFFGCEADKNRSTR